MAKIDEPRNTAQPTTPIKPPTAPQDPDQPLKPGRSDWYSYARKDHQKLAAEDKAFYADAIRRVKAAVAGVFGATGKPTVNTAPRNLGVRPQNQFDGSDRNACGTTSLASILDYFNPGSPVAKHQAIDQAIRRGDMFSSPEELMRFAQDNGYRASHKSGASLDDIRKMLDQGVPVQVMVDPDGNGSDTTLHYVAVTGYKTDASGKITGVTITDPGGGEVYEEDADHFLKRWSNLEMGGVEVGFDREMITYVPDDGRPLKGLDGQTRKASDIQLAGNGFFGDILTDSQPIRTEARGLSNIVNGALGWNPIRLLGGAFQLLVGLPGALGGLAGRYIQKGGDAALGWAKEQWQHGGAPGKVGAVFGFAGGSIAKGLGWTVSKASDAWSWGVGKIGDGIGKVGDLAKSGVGAVKKLFSGW